MTQKELEKLALLINEATAARPLIDAETFMLNHWRPFVTSLSVPDRRIAWQLYLKAQAKHVHAITAYIQTLQPSAIEQMRPALEQFASIGAIIQNLGGAPVKA